MCVETFIWFFKSIKGAVDSISLKEGIMTEFNQTSAALFSQSIVVAWWDPFPFCELTRCQYHNSRMVLPWHRGEHFISESVQDFNDEKTILSSYIYATRLLQIESLWANIQRSVLKGIFWTAFNFTCESRSRIPP